MCEHKVTVIRIWGPTIMATMALEGKCEIKEDHQDRHRGNFRARDGNNYLVVWE